MVLKVKPEFKRLIPPLQQEEYEQLERNCINEGIRDAIVTWNGFIIDGHNRYEIAQKHRLSFDELDMKFEGEENVKQWMIINQFGRRNLNAYQRSVLALELEELFRVKAKKNQGSRNDLCLNSDKSKVDTKKELAKIAGVGHDTIMKTKRIQTEANEETKEKLRRNEISINKAYQEVRKKDNEKAKQVWKEFLVNNTQANSEVVNADATTVDYPNGIRLLLTDPPYGQNFISNRRVISTKDRGINNDQELEVALSVLDGVLFKIKDSLLDDAQILVFTSWRYEPEFREVVSKHFTIKGSLVWVKNNHGSGDLEGSFAPKHERIIHAVKGNPKLIKRIPDVVYGSDKRTTHPTQKPVDLLKELILATTVEGELIVDPFAGHGSTGIATKELNRNYFLVEMDEKNYLEVLNNVK